MTGMTAGSQARVFHTLDALRGVAAIGVVIFHMQAIFLPLEAPSGYLAVDLFFMMSGVVLSHAYEDRFRSGMGVTDFMRARLIRLYPLYFLGTVFGIAVTLASLFGRNSQHWDLWSLIKSAFLALFFLPSLTGKPVDTLFPLNIPSWSLFLEILVNLLFVIFWPWLTSRLLIVVSLLTGGFVGASIAHLGNIDQGSTAATFAIGLARTLFGFSVGVLIARHIRQAHRSQNNLKVLAILVVVGVAISGSPPGELRAVWDAVCVLSVFPLIVYWGTLVDPGYKMQKVAGFLGLTSYAVYVLHSPLSAGLNSAGRLLVGEGGSSAGAPYVGIVVMLGLLAGCWLVDRYVDMPLRRYLSNVVPKMRG